MSKKKANSGGRRARCVWSRPVAFTHEGEDVCVDFDGLFVRASQLKAALGDSATVTSYESAYAIRLAIDKAKADEKAEARMKLNLPVIIDKNWVFDYDTQVCRLVGLNKRNQRLIVHPPDSDKPLKHVQQPQMAYPDRPIVRQLLTLATALRRQWRDVSQALNQLEVRTLGSSRLESDEDYDREVDRLVKTYDNAAARADAMAERKISQHFRSVVVEDATSDAQVVATIKGIKKTDVPAG
jgi:hypothetical protein